MRPDPDDLIVPQPQWTHLLLGIVGLVVFAVTMFVWAVR